MKTAVISDIHLDINEKYPVLDILAEVLHEEECTSLILAGDISSKAELTLKLIEKIRKKIEMPLWFVPGNHDMWDDENRFRDTWEIYNEYKNTEGCLCGRAVDIGENKVLTGSLGWYDYSFGDSKFSEEEFEAKNRNGRTWQDSIFAHWNMPDKEVCRYCQDEIRNAVKDINGKEITAVTHMLAIPEFTVPVEKQDWDYFNAFLGSAAYEELFKELGIKRSITGHVHYRNTIKKDNIIHQCACLGYYNEWYTDDPRKEIKDTIQYL